MSSTCKVCGANTSLAFRERILRRYDVAYFRCDKCELIQTEEPYWLSEAYQSPMSALDTGLVRRNLALMSRMALLLVLARHKHDVCLDVGGGTGIFARMMRDIGFDYYWHDRYAENIFARGFAAADMERSPKVLSLFEVIEHVPTPLSFLAELVATYEPEMIVLSTELHPGSPPSRDWHYYVFECGQHISFFSETTMRYMSEELRMHLVIAGPCQILSRQKVNPIKARIAMSRLAPLALPFIRRVMPSRVESDFAKVLHRA